MPKQSQAPAKRSSRRWWPKVIAVLCTGAVILVGTPHLLIRSAKQEIRKGHADLALKYLDQAVFFRQRSAEIEFYRARCFRRLGRTAEFRDAMESALRSGFSEQLLEREQTLFLAQAGQLRDIESKLADIFEQAGNDVDEACEAYANGLLFNMRQQEALNVVNQWAKDYPDDPRPEYVKGKIFQSLNRSELAEEAFRHALELAPDSPEIELILAEHLLETRQLDEAETVFEVLARKEKFHDVAYLSISKIQRLRGDLNASQRAIQAIRDPGEFKNGEYQLQAGLLALDQQNFSEAEKFLRAAIQKQPRLIDAQNALASALRGLGRIEESTAQAERVARAHEQVVRSNRLYDEVVARPNDPEPRLALGKIELQYGKPHLGIAWLQSVLNLQPGNADALESLAVYYETEAANNEQVRALAAHYRRLCEKHRSQNTDATPLDQN